MVFVALAPVRDAALVPGIIAQALGLREQVNISLVEQVQAFLCSKHFLLVLDNVEQVRNCASFVAGLIASCPRLHILVTSRAPLPCGQNRNYHWLRCHLRMLWPSFASALDLYDQQEAVLRAR